MWIDEYNKTKPESLKGDTEKIINDMALFEYYCYITLVTYVYEEKFDDCYEVHNIKELEASKLVNFLKSYFSRPNADLSHKQATVENFIRERNVDVIFIQEGGSIEWKVGVDY